MSATRYVTLAYGDSNALYRESLMLLLSLVAFAPEPYELVVATERPECYVWFGTRVEITFVDAARLAAWRGARPFSMRPKLELAAASMSESGPTVLLDADVLAVRPLGPFIERLRRGEMFMHRREYVLSRSRRSGNRRLWSELRRIEQKLGRADAAFTPASAMWNSGVLAFGPADKQCVDRSLALYDELAEAGLRHFATEQLVESAILGATGRLHAADAWFRHYWGNKHGYDVEISRRLADAFIEGWSVADAAAHLRADPIELPSEVRATARQKAARWLRGNRRT